MPVVKRMACSPDAGERAFAYARACGIIGKSFVGRRIPALAKISSLAELSRLVFPDAHRDMPERELLANLERQILQRTTRQILSVLKSYEHPPELLIRLLRACEYSDLKACLRNISAGKPPPLLCDIGRFRTVRFESYPDIEAMLGGTEFQFILEHGVVSLQSAGCDYTSLETELDMRYYSLLFRSMGRLSASDRFLAGRILAAEISLRNCSWALRLRTYYDLNPIEAGKFLMGIKMRRSFAAQDIDEDIHLRAAGEIALDAEARQMLRFPLDSRSAWNSWRWEKLLNPPQPGGEWAADPRYFQNAASRYIYRMVRRCFTRVPLSIGSIFCFIKLKQYEEDILTGMAEGLKLGMDGRDILHFLGAAQ